MKLGIVLFLAAMNDGSSYHFFIFLLANAQMTANLRHAREANGNAPLKWTPIGRGMS